MKLAQPYRPQQHMFGRLFSPPQDPSSDKPFRAVVSADSAAAARAELDATRPPAESDGRDDAWTPDEIEAAYRRALEAADSLTSDSQVEIADAPPTTEADSNSIGAVGSQSPEPAVDPVTSASEDTGPHVTPRQIIEALLFVGGRPLTSRQIADVLGGSLAPERVAAEIDDLNAAYTEQRRPYQIRLETGGYRLELRPHFDAIRARVFGIGPREVRLPQPALELLALVAYQQPVSRAQIDAAGIDSAGTLLRQLLRRQLIALRRGTDGDADTYITTDRFLSLFNLRSIADLPRPETIAQR